MTTPDTDTLAGLRDELRLIGCHQNGDARCTCSIGADALDAIDALRAQAAKDKARIERLEAALRPFADEAAMWGDLVPDDHAPLCVEMGHTDGAYYGSAAKYTVGDLRAARAELEDGK